MYEVRYSSRAAKSFRKIPRNHQEQLKKRIDELKENPRHTSVVKLVGFSKADYRARVGNYRILFAIDDEQKLIIIADIKRRTTTTY